MITKILTAAGIFGFIPLSMSTSKCNIVWPSILLIFYVIRSILHVQVFCELEIFFTIAHPVAFAVLQTSQFIMQCLFIGSSITGCLLRIKKFQIFIKKLQPQKDELASRKCLMIIFLSHVLYSVQLYIELEKYTSDDLPIKSIVFHWGDYQSAQYTQFFMAFFISCLGGIITKRYKTVKRNLEVTISVLIHYKDVPKTYVRQKLKPIKKSFAELYVLVGEFNSLFSWPSLLLTIGIPFNAMAGFEFLVLYKYGITSLKMSFTIQLCISTVSSINITSKLKVLKMKYVGATKILLIIIFD